MGDPMEDNNPLFGIALNDARLLKAYVMAPGHIIPHHWRGLTRVYQIGL